MRSHSKFFFNDIFFLNDCELGAERFLNFRKEFLGVFFIARDERRRDAARVADRHARRHHARRGKSFVRHRYALADRDQVLHLIVQQAAERDVVVAFPLDDVRGEPFCVCGGMLAKLHLR